PRRARLPDRTPGAADGDHRRCRRARAGRHRRAGAWSRRRHHRRRPRPPPVLRSARPARSTGVLRRERGRPVVGARSPGGRGRAAAYRRCRRPAHRTWSSRGGAGGMTATARMRELLAFIYDDRVARDLTDRLTKRHPAAPDDQRVRFGHADAVLISYADTVRDEPVPPLRTLRQVVADHAPEYTHLHVLPFFPSSGDGGFSIVDFTEVDPAHGDWDDIAALAADRRLMVDLVLNHVSSRSPWFRGFLAGDPERSDWFHVVDPSTDLSGVFRPRTHPLLTRFDTVRGREYVWTTFSADQVDLNFANPAVLEAVLDVLA